MATPVGSRAHLQQRHTTLGKPHIDQHKGLCHEKCLLIHHPNVNGANTHHTHSQTDPPWPQPATSYFPKSASPAHPTESHSAADTQTNHSSHPSIWRESHRASDRRSDHSRSRNSGAGSGVVAFWGPGEGPGRYRASRWLCRCRWCWCSRRWVPK